MVKMAKQKHRRPKAKNVLFDNRTKPIAALDQAAEAYFGAMRERLPYTLAESEAKDTLIGLMVAHDKHLYKTADGKEVSLTDSHNVRVKEATPESNGEEI
jgi:hypothetical protein